MCVAGPLHGLQGRVLPASVSSCGSRVSRGSGPRPFRVRFRLHVALVGVSVSSVPKPVRPNAHSPSWGRPVLAGPKGAPKTPHLQGPGGLSSLLAPHPSAGPSVCRPFHVGAWSQGTAEASVRACGRAPLGRCQARGAGQTRAPGGRAHSPGGAQVWQPAAASPHDLAGLPASTRCLP